MNLNLMTVSELRKLAAQFGIAGRSTMKKAELIAALSVDEFTEEAAYIEEGIEIDEADAAEHVHGEQVVLSKYSANDAIATAAFDGRSVGGHVTRERGRWVLRDGAHTIRAKTLGKAAKLWAKALGFYATAITVDTMS